MTSTVTTSKTTATSKIVTTAKVTTTSKYTTTVGPTTTSKYKTTVGPTTTLKYTTTVGPTSTSKYATTVGPTTTSNFTTTAEASTIVKVKTTVVAISNIITSTEGTSNILVPVTTKATVSSSSLSSILTDAEVTLASATTNNETIAIMTKSKNITSITTSGDEIFSTDDANDGKMNLSSLSPDVSNFWTSVSSLQTDDNDHLLTSGQFSVINNQTDTSIATTDISFLQTNNLHIGESVSYISSGEKNTSYFHSVFTSFSYLQTDLSTSLNVVNTSLQDATASSQKN